MSELMLVLLGAGMVFIFALPALVIIGVIGLFIWLINFTLKP